MAPVQPATEVGGKAEGASFLQAVCNMLNILLGVGLLSLPFAFKQAGWAGLPILAVMGLATSYTAKAVVECIETVCKREGRDLHDVGYEDVAEAAYGKAGRAIVSTTIYIELYGICALLFIIMGDNLHHLLAAQLGRDPSFYMLAAACVMIPTVWLPDVKTLSYLGFAGVAGTLSVAATVLFTFLTKSYTPGATTALVQWNTLPVAFGCLAFCFAGHGVFPAIRESMQEPSRFPAVINTAYGITASICGMMGTLGYLMYGNGVKDVVTFNLPPGLLALLCASLILISPVAKFALCLEPFAAPATDGAKRVTPGLNGGVRRFIVRTGLAISCLVTARFVPFLALLMALIGSFLTINVSLIFPALCHRKLHQGMLPMTSRVRNWTVFVLGVLCMVTGTYSSIGSIMAASA
jgi:vesicular inhibitory amino acid transporter